MTQTQNGSLQLQFTVDYVNLINCLIPMHDASVSVFCHGYLVLEQNH